MAKGLRASSTKSNRTALRSRVFEPVENARLERLHQKLLEVAQQPKPENPKKNEMELDAPEGSNDAASNDDDFPKDMDVDGATTATSSSSSKSKQKDRKAMRKAKKLRRTKPKNAIRFPVTRGKGATKPHSNARVSKR
ncbi:unnamed protein product [Periconia digitata]|uniref:DUF2423 domain-containing protein n=1 Tax=Periconia digitata TaxID=1303443 RepID=A0A9W4XM01_9PLEO|nr:unnamed protein product [Periconia digitata]